MRRFFIFILLHIVTLYSVSAHCHFLMDNANSYATDFFSDHATEYNVSDFECTELYDEDDYVFCEEVAPTRRLKDYKRLLVEVIPPARTYDICPFSYTPAPPVYPFAANRVPLSASYSFIPRLTPF